MRRNTCTSREREEKEVWCLLPLSVSGGELLPPGFPPHDGDGETQIEWRSAAVNLFREGNESE